MRTLRIVAMTVLVGAVLAGCGQAETPPTEPGGPVSSPTQPSPDPQPSSAQPGSAQSSPTSQPTSPTRPSPTYKANPVPPVKDTPRPGGGQPGGPMVLTGTIREAEVGKNCLLLDEYLLIGGPRDVVRAGARVVVTGHVAPDVVTTCMVGTPFLVERAQPA